ncbi:hypothetical protein FRB95_012659, partial [Tulasnella sp. JGI-2019a]
MFLTWNNASSVMAGDTRQQDAPGRPNVAAVPEPMRHQITLAHMTPPVLQVKAAAIPMNCQ